MAKAFELEAAREDIGGSTEHAQRPDFGDYILPKSASATQAASEPERSPWLYVADAAHAAGRTIGFSMATIHHFGVGHPMIQRTNGLGAAGIGTAISVGDMAIDRMLFPNVERKYPSVIADGASVALMFTPQPFYLKTAEALALHTVGKYLDSKV